MKNITQDLKLHRLLMNYEGVIENFIKRKVTQAHPLNEVIKLCVTSSGTNWPNVLQTWCTHAPDVMHTLTNGDGEWESTWAQIRQNVTLVNWWINMRGKWLFMVLFFHLLCRFEIFQNGLGWCGSVDWVPACEPKGCWFNSQSGHMPGFWAKS